MGLEIVRRVKELEKKTALYKYIRKGFLPDPSRIPTALTSILRKYSYKLSYIGVTETGERITKHVTISTDNLITPNAAIEIGKGYLADLPDAYGIEGYEAVDIAGMLKRA